MLFDSSYDLSEITHIQKGLKQLMVDLQARHVHTARLAHFVGQQLEQLRKAVEHWQAVRMSQQTMEQQPLHSFEPVAEERPHTAIPLQTATSLSIHSPVNEAEDITDPVPDSDDGLAANKSDSNVITGEVADIAYDTASVINEYVDGW